MRHGVDLLAVGLLRFGPESLRFFADGWGDESLLEPPSIEDVPIEAIDVRWLTSRIERRAEVRHGVFQTSLAGLPVRAQQGRILRIAPLGDSTRVVLLMPAWNEHDPKVRIALAHHLADRGIASLILENAYFGSRNPDPHGAHPIGTVADFMLMGASAVIEGRGLLHALTRDGHQVGVAGYSMGGNTAALVSATVPFPVATTPMAASHSPSPVFLDGVLRHGIAWDALGGRQQSDRLRQTLGRVSVLDYDPKPHHGTAILVGARTDAYIPRTATEALADHWPSADLQWLPGGHATLIWYRKNQLAGLIEQTFERTYPTSQPLGHNTGTPPAAPVATDRNDSAMRS